MTALDHGLPIRWSLLTCPPVCVRTRTGRYCGARLVYPVWVLHVERCCLEMGPVVEVVEVLK